MVKCSFWNEEPKETLHKAVFDHVINLQEGQKDTFERFARLGRLYSSNSVKSVDRTLLRTQLTSTGGQKSTYNLIQIAVDTLVAQVGINQPKISIMTNGGDWSEQRQAIAMEEWLYAEFKISGLYEALLDAFKDCCIFPIGAVKLFIDPKTKRIKAERVLGTDLTIDERECTTSEPRQLHQTKFVHREVLKRMFPKKAALLDKSQESPRFNSYLRVAHNMVAVIESWHLPSGPDAGDGIHSICVDNCTLFSEEYTDSHFPFLFLRYSKDITGFLGVSVGDTLAPDQFRMNKLLRHIDKQQDITNRTILAVDAQDKGGLFKLSGDQDLMGMHYRRRPPTTITFTAVSPEIYNQVAIHKDEGLRKVRITDARAYGNIPSGLETGQAVRDFYAISGDGQAPLAKMYEDCFKLAASRYLNLGKDVYSEVEPEGFPIKSPAQKIDWAKLDMERDAYLYQIETSNLFTQSPAFRLQTATEFFQAGLITKDEWRKMVKHPDLKTEIDLEASTIEDIDRVIDILLDGGYESPDPYQNLQLGMVRITQAYLKAKGDGAPEDILENFRTWLESAESLLAPPAPLPGEMPLPGAPGPQGAPMAPQGIPGAPGGLPAPGVEGLPQIGPGQGITDLLSVTQ